jgi:hypothetical protein
MTFAASFANSVPANLGITEERAREVRKATAHIYAKCMIQEGYTNSDALRDLDIACDSADCTPIERIYEAFHLGAKLVMSGAI